MIPPPIIVMVMVMPAARGCRRRRGPWRSGDSGGADGGAVFGGDVTDSYGRYGGQLGKFAEPINAEGRAVGLLGGAGAERPGANVVDQVRDFVGLFNELPGAGGQTDDRVGAEEGAGVGYGQIILTDVHAVNAHAAGTQREGDINTVVDEERLVRLDDAGDSFGELVELARTDGFGPDLDAGGVFGCPDGFEGVVACDEVEVQVEGRAGVV